MSEQLQSDSDSQRPRESLRWRVDALHVVDSRLSTIDASALALISAILEQPGIAAEITMSRAGRADASGLDVSLSIAAEGSADCDPTALRSEVEALLRSDPPKWQTSFVTDRAVETDRKHSVRIERARLTIDDTSQKRPVGFAASQVAGGATMRAPLPFGSGRGLDSFAALLGELDDIVEACVAVRSTTLTEIERTSLTLLVDSLPSDVTVPGAQRSAANAAHALLNADRLVECEISIRSDCPISGVAIHSLGTSISPLEHDPVAGTGGYTAVTVDDEDQNALDRLGRLMTLAEASTCFRLPVATNGRFPGIPVSNMPSLPLPATSLPTDGTRVGHFAARPDRPVLIGIEDRFRHVYISGQTGTGKTTTILNTVRQDIDAGAGVAVFDPHGDLVEQILRAIPAHRIDDVILVDPSDRVAVAGVNLLEAESELQRQYLLSELSSMFYSLFDPNRQGIIGPRWETMLRQAGALLMRTDTPASLLDVPTIFADQSLREFLLRDVDDPMLLEFWSAEMKSSQSRDYGEVVSWFRSKFEPFRTSSQVRGVIGQTRSTFSMNDVLASNRILLVNLSKGLIGDYNSSLLGRVIFMRLWGAVLERATMPIDERTPFFIYMDEFQNITSSSLPAMLSESRKYRVGLTLANQFFTQIDEQVRDAVMGNVGTRLTFRVGPKDAEPFAAWTGLRHSEPLTRLPNLHAIANVSVDGVPLDPFVSLTDAPAADSGAAWADDVRHASRANWAIPVDVAEQAFFERWTHVPGSFAHQAARREELATAEADGNQFLDSWLEKKQREQKR